MIGFHDPSVWLLGLLVLVPLAWWIWWRRRRRPVIGFSSLDGARRAGRTWAARARWIVPLLRALALAGLVVCLARPRRADEQTRVFTEGLAIQLVVDRSGSMRAHDFVVDGRRTSRLEAVKSVVKRFVAGGGELGGRPDDLLGLIQFASFPDSVCPPTLDHDYLLETIAQVEPAVGQTEAQTAIGDALALAVERLQRLGERGDLVAGGRIESKVVILLTDGESNVDEIPPLTAAEMAAAFGIKVYTIGAGSDNEIVPIPRRLPDGREIMRPQRVSIDEETLRAIAEATDGAYFRATDTDSLEAVYARIDELEKTKIEQRRYQRYRELALDGGRLGAVPVPPLLAVVFVVLALETLLAHTRFRTLP